MTAACDHVDRVRVIRGDDGQPVGTWCEACGKTWAIEEELG